MGPESQTQKKAREGILSFARSSFKEETNDHKPQFSRDQLTSRPQVPKRGSFQEYGKTILWYANQPSR